MKTQKASTEIPRNGFAIADLLAVMFMLGLLTCLVVPAAAKSKAVDLSASCRWNLAQLARAWTVYSDDNRGVMPPVYHGGDAQNPVANDPRAPWATGWLDWGISRSNTNAAYLIDPRYSSIAKYLSGNASVYKCPADRFLSSAQVRLGWSQRVRSVSVNIVVGDGNAETGLFDNRYFHVRKLSDFRFPSPSEAMVYLDEHADSINDPAFFSPSGNQFIDMPGNYHDGGGGFAFADGHSTIHRWSSSGLRTLRVTTQFLGLPLTSRADLEWMRYHTPRVKEGL